MPQALRAAWGDEAGTALAGEYQMLSHMQDEFEIDRRSELSNLVRY